MEENVTYKLLLSTAALFGFYAVFCGFLSGVSFIFMSNSLAPEGSENIDISIIYPYLVGLFFIAFVYASINQYLEFKHALKNRSKNT